MFLNFLLKQISRRTSMDMRFNHDKQVCLDSSVRSYAVQSQLTVEDPRNHRGKIILKYVFFKYFHFNYAQREIWLKRWES